MMYNFQSGDKVYFIDDGSVMYIDRHTITEGTVSECTDYSVTMYVDGEEELRVVSRADVFPTQLLTLMCLHDYFSAKLDSLGKAIEFVKTREGSV